MLTKITSADNSRIRLVRKLKTRKGRSEEGRFTAEGRNLIREILDRGIKPDFIMIPEGMADTAPAESARLIKECIVSPDIMVCEIPVREFEKLADAESGIGMLAVVRCAESDAGLIDRLRPADNLLVLDRIQDPGNMGTLIRTAVAAGYKAIIALSGTVDIYSPKVLRATAGMIFEIPVIYVRDAAACIDILKRSGRRIAVSAVDNGVPYYKADLSSGVALVIGNEGSGVSGRIMDQADIRVTIPMKGRTESLNAAVAASILMYESVRCGQDRDNS